MEIIWLEKEKGELWKVVSSGVEAFDLTGGEGG